ncbi:PepSY-associated TM helix domain-containing protein [Croceiramulus getboli]|nr:PepSY-associated TM helix domain-containing protein [Flavobacteriaceae bacterium YJPT1-3]
MPKKKNNIKKIIRYVHLYAGLAAGLVLSIVGITGSLYVFEPEIASLLEKKIYHTEKSETLFQDDIAIATYIENLANKDIESIQWPKRGRETYVFKFFDDDQWYFFDQSTGELYSGRNGLGNDMFTLILDLHTTLKMGETGRIITGVASLLFAFLMLTTGLYLWWPNNKGRRKSSFKIKWDAKKKRLNYDLHNVTGFYFFLPLFLLGFTGAAFYFDDEMQWVINKVTFSAPAEVSVFDMETEPYKSTKDYLSTQEALSEMNKYYPEHYKRNFWMTRELDGALSFAYQERIDIHAGAVPLIFLRADPVTGKITGENNPDKMPRGASFMANWHLPIHFGEFGGIFTRILWFFSGLLPAFLTYTGAKIWWGRAKT